MGAVVMRQSFYIVTRSTTPIRLIEDIAVLHYREHRDGASKRYVETMQANATRVLAETYAHAGMPDAGRGAALVVSHLMRGRAVPDRATLARLGEVLGRLQELFLSHRPVTAAEHRAIRWETATRWGRVLRGSLRSGGISLRDAVRVRPEHLGLGYLGAEALLSSSLLGLLRSAVGRGG